MIKDGIVYRNLENQVEYLTDYLNTEAQLVELGIKVVGTAEKREDIPEGQYEYGDAYMIGTSEPYIMWVWTRADRTHPQDYWFEVGPFPMPGPQGPKGDGLEQINKWTNGTVSNVTYDTTNGAKVTQTTTVDYTDSTDGSTKQQQFETTTTLPIVPGKYISMNTTSDNKKMEVKVDDTALALDYFKIDKSDYPAAMVPTYYKGKQGYKLIGYQSGIGSLVMRGGNSEIKCDAIDANYWRNLDGNQALVFTDVKSQLTNGSFVVPKTATDTGSISTSQLTVLKKLPQYQIQYNNQTYYRMDPLNAPDGTLNYIHLDSIEDGNGGYKATGKCFSVTVSTRAWKVFDLDLGGSTTYKHVTQMHVVIPGDDDYYLTIFNTDKHGAMYNLNSASTLLDNIGTAGTIAYKQNTANGVYMPVHVSKNSSGNWAWNMGSASGTFTTNQIDLITDDYETIG